MVAWRVGVNTESAKTSVWKRGARVGLGATRGPMRVGWVGIRERGFGLRVESEVENAWVD
jgi:hypothetical protein